MRVPATPPSFREWLLFADDDRSAARTLMRSRHALYGIVCLHAQQAAEKLLKAFLVHHGQAPQRTHDCALLLAECVVLDATLAPLHGDAVLVTQYGVAPRYPDSPIMPARGDARDALHAMERIRAAVLALLPT